MYPSLKTISMIAITLTTMGVMPSYGLQSGMSSKAAISSSAESHLSNVPASSSYKNQTIPSTLLASYQNSTVGENIAMRVRNSYGRIRFLTKWSNLSTREIARVAEEICNSYDGRNTNDFAEIVSRYLGGQDDAGSLTEAHIIIISSMQSSCRGTYSQYMAKRGLEILRSR